MVEEPRFAPTVIVIFAWLAMRQVSPDSRQATVNATNSGALMAPRLVRVPLLEASQLPGSSPEHTGHDGRHGDDQGDEHQADELVPPEPDGGVYVEIRHACAGWGAHREVEVDRRPNNELPGPVSFHAVPSDKCGIIRGGCP